MGVTVHSIVVYSMNSKTIFEFQHNHTKQETSHFQEERKKISLTTVVLNTVLLYSLNVITIFISSSSLGKSLGNFFLLCAMKKKAESLRSIAIYCWEKEGNTIKALELLGKSIEIVPLPLSFFARADLNAEIGKPEKAISDYDTGLRIVSSPDALFNKELLLHEMGRYEEALEAIVLFEIIENSKQTDVGLITEKALILNHLGRAEESLITLAPLLKGKQEIDLDVLISVCRILFSVDHDDEAIQVANRIVDFVNGKNENSLEPSESYCIAQALRILGKEDDAQHFYRLALKLLGNIASSDEAMKCYDKAKVFFRLGYHEQAAELAKKALEKRNWFPKAASILARSLAGCGKINEAMNTAEIAIQQRPHHLKSISFLQSLRELITEH